MCMLGLFWLPETKDANLNDKLTQIVRHEKVNNGVI